PAYFLAAISGDRVGTGRCVRRLHQVTAVRGRLSRDRPKRLVAPCVRQVELSEAGRSSLHTEVVRSRGHGTLRRTERASPERPEDTQIWFLYRSVRHSRPLLGTGTDATLEKGNVVGPGSVRRFDDTG